MTLLAARAFGASCIYISDIDGKRLEIAKKVDGGVITIDASGKTPGEVVAMLGVCVYVCACVCVCVYACMDRFV